MTETPTAALSHAPRPGTRQWTSRPCGSPGSTAQRASVSLISTTQPRPCTRRSRRRMLITVARYMKIIAAHYTDIIAHKFRRQACTVLKDQACSDHEHFVEFGLLDSILKTGDGKTPETAMLVADVSEEYVVIGLGGQRPGGQALVNRNGKVYDQMTVTDQNNQATDALVRHLDRHHQGITGTVLGPGCRSGHRDRGCSSARKLRLVLDDDAAVGDQTLLRLVDVVDLHLETPDRAARSRSI